MKTSEPPSLPVHCRIIPPISPRETHIIPGIPPRLPPLQISPARRADPHHMDPPHCGYADDVSPKSPPLETKPDHLLGRPAQRDASSPIGRPARSARGRKSRNSQNPVCVGRVRDQLSSAGDEEGEGGRRTRCHICRDGAAGGISPSYVPVERGAGRELDRVARLRTVFHVNGCPRAAACSLLNSTAWS